jgi:hypothetical protein
MERQLTNCFYAVVCKSRGIIRCAAAAGDGSQRAIVAAVRHIVL